MSDLRFALSVLFPCRCEPIWRDRHMHSPECHHWAQADVLGEVEEWLTSDATVERVARALWPWLYVEQMPWDSLSAEERGEALDAARAALAAALAPEEAS